MTHSANILPNLGFGLGLRPQHYPHVFEHKPKVDWFEVISENFMDTDGRPKRNLARIRENYPVVMHGVAMSIGTVDPLNSEYLKKLKDLMNWLEPAWVSDHLCWTGIAHRNTHDLLPVPYTEEALKHIVSRIQQVQDYLGRPIALENPSTYLEFKSSSMPEAEFMSRMVKDSGCYLLLDVNNIYVSCYNHRLDAKAYVDSMPLDRVIQVHLAGHDNKGTHIVDTHDGHVVDEVWALYKYAIHKAGRIPNTMIEWDDHIPEFNVLYDELNKARVAAASAHDFGDLPDLSAPRENYIANEIIPVAEQQTRMQNAILLKDEADPGSWIRDKHQFPPQAQLDVYINAYRYRLYDVVAEDYPVLAYYLGAEKFETLLWDFINSNPSQHFNIARYAARLPDFVIHKLPDDIFAQELCELETILTQLTDAQETPVLTQASISGMTPGELMESILLLRTACALKKFTYPVNQYYIDMMNEKVPHMPERQESYLAIFRHEDKMWRADLDKSEYELLSKLFVGAKLGDALGGMDESSVQNITEWFARWMNIGLLSELKFSDKIEGNRHVAA